MRRLCLVLVSVALMIGASGSPASAQTKKRLDTFGDAARSLDIRSVRVQDNERRLAVTVRLRRVKPGGTAVAVFLSPRRDPEYTVYSLPTGKRSYMVELRRFDPEVDEEGDRAVTCPGVAVRWKQGRNGYARFVVPQRCLVGRERSQLQTGTLAFDVSDRGSRGGGLAMLRRGDGDGDLVPTDSAPNSGVIRTRQG